MWPIYYVKRGADRRLSPTSWANIITDRIITEHHLIDRTRSPKGSYIYVTMTIFIQAFRG